MDIKQYLIKDLPPAKHNKNLIVQVIDPGIDGAFFKSTGEVWAQMGGADPSQSNTYTKAQRAQIVALSAVSNTYTPDFSSGNFFSFTAAANFTLANPTNMPEAGITQSGSFFINMNGTGGWTMTLGNAYVAAGGLSTITLTTTANARNRIDYVVGPTGLIHLSVGKDVKA